jgi:hypothetical protein
MDIRQVNILLDELSSFSQYSTTGNYRLICAFFDSTDSNLKRDWTQTKTHDSQETPCSLGFVFKAKLCLCEMDHADSLKGHDSYDFLLDEYSVCFPSVR